VTHCSRSLFTLEGLIKVTVRTFIIFLLLVLTVAAAEENSEIRTLMVDYASIALREHKLMHGERFAVSDYVVEKALVSCIKTKDDRDLCQVVFPHVTRENASYFVGFEREFSSRFHTIFWRGRGGSASEVDIQFQSLEGKILDIESD